MRAHEFWRERTTGQVWAIELREGLVVGCFGPLEHADIDDELLHRYDYSSDRAGWIEQHREEFDVYEGVRL